MEWKSENWGFVGCLMDIMASLRLIPFDVFSLSRNSISQVFRVTSFVVVHIACHALSLSIFCHPCVFRTKSMSGTSLILVWSVNLWLMLTLPAYKAINCSLASDMSISSIYTWSMQNWFSLDISPWVPKEILLQQRPTGISSMKWEISCSRIFMLMVLVKKRRHLTNTGDSVWIAASHSPILESLNQLPCSFVISPSSELHPRSAVV